MNFFFTQFLRIPPEMFLGNLIDSLMSPKTFHAASKLAKTTFNKFTPPPKKKAFWGEGVSFLEYFHEFWGLGHKKNIRKTLG